MSTTNSMLKFVSKYGGEDAATNIAGNPRYRNINSDRLRVIFDNNDSRDKFTGELRDSVNEFLKGQKPRQPVYGRAVDDQSFLKKINKQKLNGGSLKEMTDTLDEFRKNKKCSCGEKKRMFNGNFRTACNCYI